MKLKGWRLGMSDKLTIEDLEEAKKILEDNQKKTPFINTVPELLLNLDRENKELKRQKQENFGLFWQLLGLVDDYNPKPLDRALIKGCFDHLNECGLSKHRPMFEEASEK
jgi:hypothetical protein